MTEGATYFVVSSPAYGEYVKDEWLVFAARHDQPKWWQLIARFTEECRANLYADIENDSQVTEADPVPSGLSIPPSALEKISAVVKTGNIFAVPTSVTVDYPSPTEQELDSARKVFGETLDISAVPKPRKAKSKKTNAHFPSDKWDEPATKRFADLRAEGKPFGEISKILNEEFPGRGYTKAACTGKADRLGLPKPEIINESVKPEIGSDDDDGAFPLSDVMEVIEKANNETTEEAVKTRLEGLQDENLQSLAATLKTVPLVNEAIRWYRTLAHAVYKIDGKIQVDHGDMLSPDEFLALVNPERERMSLPAFVDQQEAAD